LYRGMERRRRRTCRTALASFASDAVGQSARQFHVRPGDRYVLRHDRALSLQSLPDFLQLLDEYRIQVTLLAPSTPAVGLLDRLPDRKRAYADDVAVVHMRR